MTSQWIDRKDDPQWTLTEGLWMRSTRASLWFAVRFINLESQDGQGLVCEASMIDFDQVPKIDMFAAAAKAELNLDEECMRSEIGRRLVQALID